MLIEALAMMLAAAAPQKPPALVIAPASLLAKAPTPAYAPEMRAVDNWRQESALNLELTPLAAIRRVAELDNEKPARCVKLNNYWCVKSAGWPGQIASDAEGHVAFASAEESAAVAALLLRRYYVDYKLHSARAIVERWAPARCSPIAAPPVARQTRPGAVVSRAGLARMLPQRIVPMGLAPFGIENTLRARWLAAHGRGGVAAPTSGDIARERKYDEIIQRNARKESGARRIEAGRAAPQRDSVRLAPTPSIMEGVGESRPFPQAAIPKTVIDWSAPTGDVVSCSSELARIANYATSLAQGVGLDVNADLKLFDAAGQPTDNLARAMLNMAAVEIGPDRPRAFLVTAAVAQLRRMLKNPAMAATESAETPPGANSSAAP
ncbi:MAG: hypothetical protein N2444_07260 [Methylocystis sp.]|nr:hypothetical protein [Methylocystis sp.]